MGPANDLNVSSVFQREPRRRLGPVKKLAAGLLAGAVAAGLWRFASWVLPKLRTRASEMCERMIEEMPETFPPKRLFANVETIREQNERLLRLLEERTLSESTGDGDARPGTTQSRAPAGRSAHAAGRNR